MKLLKMVYRNTCEEEELEGFICEEEETYFITKYWMNVLNDKDEVLGSISGYVLNLDRVKQDIIQNNGSNFFIELDCISQLCCNLAHYVIQNIAKFNDGGSVYFLNNIKTKLSFEEEKELLNLIHEEISATIIYSLGCIELDDDFLEREDGYWDLHEKMIKDMGWQYDKETSFYISNQQPSESNAIDVNEDEDIDIDLDELTVVISHRTNKYMGDASEHLYINVSLYEDEYEEDAIGDATYFMYDATRFHGSYIRDIADGYSLDMYQAVSSVRIYRDEEYAEMDEFMGYEEDQEDKMTNWQMIQSVSQMFYPKGSEQGTFEGKSYHPNTTSVWGRILVLNEISIKEEYRKPVILKEYFQQMLQGFKNLGFDWVIVNPNINEQYMVEHHYPCHTTSDYQNLLSLVGFEASHGRLHNNQVCYCYQLQKDE